MLSVPHLDREFDYLVSADQSDDAQPGVRVRVRFHGRLVDAFLLERRSDTDHVGQLGWLDRVISPEPVLTPEVRRLVDAVVARYAGTRPDVLRLAIPPRHAGAEKSRRGAAAAGHAARRLRRMGPLRPRRAVPGGSVRAVPPARCGRRCRGTLVRSAGGGGGRSGRRRPGVLAVVPDQRDVDALWQAATAMVDESAVVALAAGLRPSERYRRWLAVLRGEARLVIRTRSAVFAPVDRLGLVIVWDDGDDTLAEPRSPYPHAARGRHAACPPAALRGDRRRFRARTAEAQALVGSGWAHDLVAPRPVVRAERRESLRSRTAGTPRTRPGGAHRTAAVRGSARRTGRARPGRPGPGSGAPPRLPALGGLARCRTIARCRHCMGRCRCPTATPRARCAGGVVGSTSPAVPPVRLRGDPGGGGGGRRTAEELGRAFRDTR